VSSKGVSRVSDKVYEGKAGPNGETIYIEDDGRYYWVNNKGNKVYVKSTQLRDK
jgi:hypothetical protein